MNIDTKLVANKEANSFDSKNIGNNILACVTNGVLLKLPGSCLLWCSENTTPEDKPLIEV